MMEGLEEEEKGISYGGRHVGVGGLFRGLEGQERVWQSKGFLPAPSCDPKQ